MKCICDRAALLEALSVATAVTPTRTPKPVLECVRFTAEADQVVVTAYDQEVGVRCRVRQVEVSRPGETLVLGKRLLDIVRESGDETLAFEIKADVLHVRGADSHFEVVGQNVREFPPVPDVEGEPQFSVAVGALREAAAQTVFAAARESTRYAINGVLWELKGKRLQLVATDGRRLAMSAAAVEKVAGDAEVRAIIPTKVVHLLLRMHVEPEELVEVYLSSNKVVMRTAAATISSALVEGHFPRYEDVIPRDHDTVISLNTLDFLSAVRRAALLASAESRGIRLTLDDGTLVLSGRSAEQGEATISLNVQYSGPKLLIGFNPEFVAEALKVSGETTTLELKDGSKPGIFKSGPNFKYVVMPVNL